MGPNTTTPAGCSELVISMKTFCVLLLTCTLSLATAGAATEQEMVNQSASILRDFRRMPEKGIPARVLRDARGLAIIKVVEVGFGISGRGGQGVVTVAARAIHPFSGLVGGLLILVDYFLTAALSALSGVIYLTVVAGPLKPLVLVVTVAALILLGLLNLVGVKTSAQVTAIFAIAAAAGQLAVVVSVAIHLGPSGLLNSFSHLLAGPRLSPLAVLTGVAGA